MEFFGDICEENLEIGLGMKYVILGKVFDLKIKDTGGETTSSKISFFGSNVSSTGKDQGRKALNIAVDEINKRDFLKKSIEFDSSVDVNDAALVGTRKLVKKESVPVFGKFSKYDIMCFPECSTLFKKTEYKTTMIQIIQGALDHPGYVSKSLADIEIKYPTNTSIVMLSTPFKTMTSHLLDTGFFQRFLLFIGNKDYIDIQNTSSNLAKEMINGSTSNNTPKKLNDFVDKVELAHRKRPIKHIVFSNGCMEKIKEYERMFISTRDEEFDKEEDKTLYATFQPRMVKTFIRLSAINSVYNSHEKVLPEDFNEPLEMMKWNIDSIVKLMRMRDDKIIKKPSTNEEIIKIISGAKNTTESYKRICKNEHVNMNKAIEIYKRVMDNKI